ncbi:tripartite tricarboxylate transporter TctB family protein [Phaeobacter sp. HF9A]|uniref:tripartite tricarboxylate transporter TctB family protein n=1 Tax=Phaeobacter sp. HF9A TaxID=2721561 RepID=UPI0014306E18|nr:tripartite tricarboxylate transporter TctB family protein [Phaeobacter sp. HF9A]NIZ13067.1 tripartite tricarboxylate transporter TctB family protein [Phaeobacter sp. HF9A]
MEDYKKALGWRLRWDVIRGALPVLDLVGCAALLVVFWRYFAQAAALPAPLNKIDIGAGGFPTLLALAALLATAAVAVSAIVRIVDPVPVTWVSIRRPLYVLGTVGLLILQSLYFERLGTLPSVLIFAFLTMLACGERRPLHVIGVPLVLAGFIYVVFNLALDVNLP